MHFFPRRLALLAPLALSLWCVAGCAGPSASVPATTSSYRVIWSVRRASDQAKLAGVVSPPLRVGAGDLHVRTDSRAPAENRPAFPEFMARLSPIRRSALVELVTRVSVREEYRTRKGKRKTSKRFIGGLLPIRPGETLGVSGPGDPITVEVRIESAGAAVPGKD